MCTDWDFKAHNFRKAALKPGDSLADGREVKELIAVKKTSKRHRGVSSPKSFANKSFHSFEIDHSPIHKERELERDGKTNTSENRNSVLINLNGN